MSFCIYRLLYLKNSVFNRPFLYFQDYFSNASKPTARNLFFLVISILTLDIFRSVHFVHSHVISKLSDTSLNAFYYTLKMNAYTHSVWNDVTVSKAVHLFLALWKFSRFFFLLMMLWSKNLVSILNFVPNCMIMLPTMAPIILMDIVWSVSCSLFRCIKMRKSSMFLFQWAIGSEIRKSDICPGYCVQTRKREPPSVLMHSWSENYFLWLGEQCGQNSLFLWGKKWCPGNSVWN